MSAAGVQCHLPPVDGPGLAVRISVGHAASASCAEVELLGEFGEFTFISKSQPFVVSATQPLGTTIQLVTIAISHSYTCPGVSGSALSCGCHGHYGLLLTGSSAQ